MRLVPVALLLGLAACAAIEAPVSKTTEATVDFEIPPPDVDGGWPCPPFDQSTDLDGLGDGDRDGFYDCQEANLSLDPTLADSDGDGIDDYTEVGTGGLLDPEDTDEDGTIDALDADDDGDGIPSADELDAPDHDGDGIPSYLDGDDDNDEILGEFEDVNGNGDLDDDDADGDGLPNWLDDDDDGDTAPSISEHLSDEPNDEDLDEDGTPNWLDDDDDGDGIPTAEETAGGLFPPELADFDADRRPDFLDLDEDGDEVDTVAEDLDGDGDYAEHDSDGDGDPDYRDLDDDDDGAVGEDELPADAKLGVAEEDTDGDSRPNYRDPDDDGDGCLSVDEDADGNGDPSNDDADANDIPDFLDPGTTDCASPSPEPPASWTLTLSLDGAPAAVRNADVLLTLVGPGDDLVATGTLAAGAATLEVPGLASNASYDLDLTLDIQGLTGADPADGICNLGTDEESLWSFRFAVTTVNYDLDAAFDLGGQSEPAACATHQ